MAAPSGFAPDRLTQSSRRALHWAAHRARLWSEAQARPGQKGSRPSRSAAPVRISDLLVGILMSHGEGSEPRLLLLAAGLQADERLEEVLAPTGFTPATAPGEAPETKSPPTLDPDAAAALERAGELASKLSPEGPLVRLRDLFGGILLGSSEGPSLVGRLLEGGRLTLEEVLSRYPAFLELDSSSSLADFLGEAVQEGSNVEQSVDPVGEGDGEARGPADDPPSQLAPRVAVLDGDTPSGDDWVGIGPEVDAMARLVVAPTLRPPLAIGLFGDWGSGKSFFMQCLRDRVDALTLAARESSRPQGELGVYRHVAQIDFNAWHYVEGNLWASLTEHIFQSLGQEDGEDPTGEARIHAWTRELESQRVARTEVNRRLEALRVEQRRRAEQLEEGRAQRRAKLEALQEVRARDVLAEVALDPRVREPVESLLQQVGLTDLKATGRETREALGDVRAVLQRGNGLLTPLRRRGTAGVRWALLLVAVVLAGPLTAWVLGLVQGSPAIDGVTRTFTGIAAFLSSLTILLRKGSGWLSSSLDRVEQAQAHLERARARRAEELAREEAGLKHELDILDDEMGRLSDRKAEIDGRIRDIEAELATLTPSRLLADFIDERVGSEDYRKHLGVPALVRRDFHRLSDLIRRRNLAILDGADPDQDGLPLVNRVVLYIDDLDRCPPERVVEVLQAVHLLLAFELFVVVVAVDARWLSRSLVSRYEALLGPDGASGSASATPGDYLEKIFQVPFHVRPLDEEAQRRLLRGLLPPSLPGGNGRRSSAGEEDPSARDRDGHVAPAADPGVPAGAEAPEEELAGSPGVPAVEPGAATPTTVASSPHAPSPVSALDLEAGRLEIRPEEVAFMEDLRPLLGRTPRAMKRFVNVYRLLAAIAGPRTPGYHVEGGEDGLPAPYRRAMFLLAVVTGLPELSGEVIRSIREGDRAVGREQRTDETTTMEWVLGVHARGGLVLRPEGPSPEYRRLSGWLRGHEEGRWLTLPVSALAPWVDPVRRFSFRSEVGIDR